MGTKSLILFLLITVVIASVPQTLAKQQYAEALQITYGTGLCVYCHGDPNGGKLLTDYGSKFKSQSVYQNDPVTVLKNIGVPPGFGIIATIGIISAMYIMRKYKIGKR